VSPVRRRGAPQEPRAVHRRQGRDRSQREFYVVVEGEVTERDYLAFLNAELGDRGRFFIHPIASRHGLKPPEVVRRAIDQLDELAHAPAGEQDIAEGRAQVWALFDRDRHAGIPQVFAMAEPTAVQVAFSHPSFDLWLLLHFQNLSSAEGGSSDVVHAKLRTADRAYVTFGTNGDKSVTDARAQALLGREGQAARHARKLVEDCPSGTCSAASVHGAACPPLERDPSTDLWRLLEALRIV
jgi:RloB-like protein